MSIILRLIIIYYVPLIISYPPLYYKMAQKQRQTIDIISIICPYKERNISTVPISLISQHNVRKLHCLCALYLLFLYVVKALYHQQY